jgi:hypothetical protein
MKHEFAAKIAKDDATAKKKLQEMQMVHANKLAEFRQNLNHERGRAKDLLVPESKEGIFCGSFSAPPVNDGCGTHGDT